MNKKQKKILVKLLVGPVAAGSMLASICGLKNDVLPWTADNSQNDVAYWVALTNLPKDTEFVQAHVITGSHGKMEHLASGTAGVVTATTKVFIQIFTV